MSKKKKNPDLLPWPEERWLAQFASIGITDPEEIYELIYDSDECVELENEEVDNGFPNFMVGDTYQNDKVLPETLHISKYKEKYIMWIMEANVGDGSWYLDNNYAFLFDTLEEARAFRDSCPKGEEHIDEQIRECEEQLNDQSIYIESNNAWGHTYDFSVFYNHDLIIENLRSLKDTEYISSAVKSYNELKEKLNNMDVHLWNIEKLPREWSSNIRFYGYELSLMDKRWTEKGQILSKYQHQTRTTIDLFPWNSVKSIVTKAKENGKYEEYLEREKEQLEERESRFNAALDGIPYNHYDNSILPVELNKKKRKGLKRYLNHDVNAINTCDCTFKHTVCWLKENIPTEKQAGVLRWLESCGGNCDCEILLNTVL